MPVGTHVSTAWIGNLQVNVGSSHAADVAEDHAATTNEVVFAEASESQGSSTSTSEVSSKICSRPAVAPPAATLLSLACLTFQTHLSIIDSVFVCYRRDTNQQT